MKFIRLLSFSSLLLLMPLKQGFAEITLLAHGYMSNPAVWEVSGVNNNGSATGDHLPIYTTCSRFDCQLAASQDLILRGFEGKISGQLNEQLA